MSVRHGIADGLGGDAGRLLPPWSLIVAWAAGMSLEQWVLIAGLLYTLVMLVHRVWHWRAPPGGKSH